MSVVVKPHFFVQFEKKQEKRGKIKRKKEKWRDCNKVIYNEKENVYYIIEQKLGKLEKLGGSYVGCAGSSFRGGV